MSAVRTTTSLAPSTVTDASTGTLNFETFQRPRRRRDKAGRWVDSVTRSQIPDRLLASSLQQAGGDANRLWFGPDGAVWILNHTRATKCPSPACPACNPR